jgi:hypothetical protein
MAEQHRNGYYSPADTDSGSHDNYSQVVYSPTGQKLAIVANQSLTKAYVPIPGGATAVYDSTGLAYFRHPIGWAVQGSPPPDREEPPPNRRTSTRRSGR